MLNYVQDFKNGRFKGVNSQPVKEKCWPSIKKEIINKRKGNYFNENITYREQTGTFDLKSSYALLISTAKITKPIRDF